MSVHNIELNQMDFIDSLNSRIYLIYDFQQVNCIFSVLVSSCAE